MAVAVTYAGTSLGLSNPLCEHHVIVSVSRTYVSFMKSYTFRLLLQGALQALAGVCQAQQCGVCSHVCRDLSRLLQFPLQAAQWHLTPSLLRGLRLIRHNSIWRYALRLECEVRQESNLW